MVDPEDDDPEDGGGGGEDHHGGVVDAENGRVVRGGDTTGHRHQEHLEQSHPLLRLFLGPGLGQTLTVMFSMVEIPRVTFSPDSAGMRKTKL